VPACRHRSFDHCATVSAMTYSMFEGKKVRLRESGRRTGSTSSTGTLIATPSAMAGRSGRRWAKGAKEFASRSRSRSRPMETPASSSDAGQRTGRSINTRVDARRFNSSTASARTRTLGPQLRRGVAGAHLPVHVRRVWLPRCRPWSTRSTSGRSMHHKFGMVLEGHCAMAVDGRFWDVYIRDDGCGVLRRYGGEMGT
jgi:hypothetical protein